MRKALMLIVLASPLLFLLFHLPTVDVPSVFALTQNGEHNCPTTTAIPSQTGTPGVFSANQNLCLPQRANIGPLPLAFVVQGVEPGIRVDSHGTVYAVSIRGVPGGIDLWRWYATADGAADSTTKTLPFRYQGQPDSPFCGIFSSGCTAPPVIGSPGVAPGGGDADIAVNSPSSGVPNLAVTSLSLLSVTASHSTDRGNTFMPNPPNVLAATILGDDRQWNDAIDTSTVYLEYHDVATFNIDVQRSFNGGATYLNGVGQAIDPATAPAAITAAGAANIAGQTRVDHSRCPSRGNLYQIFAAPDNATENVTGAALRDLYVGVSIDAKLGSPLLPLPFMFTDYKILNNGPAGNHNQGAVNLFPALATDDFGFVYAAWSDQTNINFSSSSDHGKTWTAPMAVNSTPTVGKSNVFPWVAADANGHVAVVWLGANLAGNSNDPTVMEVTCPLAAHPTNECWAQWEVYMAETVNGHDPVPAFLQYQASDHVIHLGTVSTGGLGGNANRNLADFFQVALDPQHRANISFADDHIVSPLCTTQSPNHCAANDPQSFRTGQPYFTYKLNPPNGLRTEGTCAGQATDGQEEDEAEGDDNEGDHVDSVDRKDDQHQTENGTFHYRDSSRDMDVVSSNGVRSITYGGSCVSFIGDAKVNRVPGYQFTFSACDLSASGGIGTFAITLTGPGGFSYSKNSTLTNGFVKLHVLL